MESLAIARLCQAGTEARDLSLKDRISLQARVNAKIINGESEEAIRAYVAAYKREFSLNVPEGFGLCFVNYLSRAGWSFTLLALVVHHAFR